MNATDEPRDHPDLYALVRGELTNADALDAGDHLDACVACRAELTEVVVGHAVLTRAVRTLGPSTAPAGADALVEPPLPPLAVPTSGAARRGGRLALVAAAAAVVGGAVVGSVMGLTGSDSDPEDPGPTPPAAQVVVLDPVEGSAHGEVRMERDASGTVMTIRAPDLPGTEAGQFYQAWLLDPATNKMLPLGLVSGDETTFRVDDALVSAYGAVDVSLEADDGDPQHSVTSVLRGTY